MKLERHFFDWHWPMLPAVADFLLQRYVKDGVCDLSSVILITPSRRAGRRLLEILAWHAEEWKERHASPLLLFAPQVMTVGQLPTLLIETAQPVAGELQAVAAWIKALNEIPHNVLKRLFAEIPAQDDYLGWWPLAQELYSLHREISVAQVSYEAIKQYCANFDANSAARWEVLQAIANRAHDWLQQANFVDSSTAVQRAIKNRSVNRDLTVVLVSVVDLNIETRRLLETSDCEVLTLIHADKGDEAGFGPLGELVPEYWQQQTIPLDENQIHPVEHSIDQVTAVAELLDTLQEVSSDCIAIGMGDESLAPMLERVLEHRERATHRAAVTLLAQSAPMRLLVCLAEFVTDARPRNFQHLILQPDFADWVLQRIDKAATHTDLQTITDRYLADYLPLQITVKSFKLPEQLKAVLSAVDELVPPEQNERLPAGDWISQVRFILEKIYEGKTYREDVRGESEQYRAFEALGALLDEIKTLSSSESLSPELSLGAFIRLLLYLAKGKNLPQQAVPDAVELTGWLELHLDDAPVLMITNLNEGIIPANVDASPFLNDGLRTHFNLMNNDRRYARDAYLLAAILHSRQKVDVVFAGHSPQGDPLQPSRLLFACEPQKVRERAQQYYQEANKPHIISPPFLNYGQESLLSDIPHPQPLSEPLIKLNVTAFRSYLECPYRFYLQYIQGLGVMDEIVMEMEARNFGTLLHNVLNSFANDALADRGWNAASEEQIAQRLGQLLDEAAMKSFGRARMASVEIQLHQAQRRLQAFARNQKQVFNAGWEIHQAECKLEHEVQVDAQPFGIYGRVDRIDFHPDTGQYRILDYKIGDSFRKPEQTHRSGLKNDKRWTDLQLPLYRLLIEKINIKAAATEVGYFGLPADLAHKGLEMANWTEEDFVEAQSIAFWVIRQLRNEIFWPPSSVTQPSGDTIGAICRDADPRKRQT